MSMNKNKLLFLFFMFYYSVLQSQEISRNTISVVATSNNISNGYYISQSIGQLSTIGFSDLIDKSVIQGFQQPIGFKVIDSSTEKESLKLYPIPTSDELNIQFTNSIDGQCIVELFDYLGRLVLSKECKISDYKTSISLKDLASSSYLIKITNKTSIFYETIIKKN